MNLNGSAAINEEMGSELSFFVVSQERYTNSLEKYDDYEFYYIK